MRIEDKILVDEYNKLGSANKVGKKLGVPGITVSYRLKKIGVLKKHKKNIDEQKMVDLYSVMQSVRRVAKEFGVSHELIRYKLEKLGLLNKPFEKYNCNEDFFSCPTHESFYWAGFIAADGCVKLKDKKYKQLSIGLSDLDHHQIEKFKTAISFDGTIHHTAINTGGFTSEICISSDKLFDDLARFNIVPRKSLVLAFPEWLVKHIGVNHFMRGYFDGDGSFYYSIDKNKKTKQLYFSLRGTKEFLTVYRDILEKNCELEHNENKPRLNGGIYTLEYGGNNIIKKIASFLYKDSTNETRLDRKYNLVQGEYNGI